jgi:hypothetical protein
MHKWARALTRHAWIVAAGAVAGCGVQVPTIEPLARSQAEVGFIVNKIANHIGCEIGYAMLGIHSRYRRSGLADRIKWLDNWAAKITLTIQVEEKTALAPGISFRTLFPNATTTFGSQTITTGQFFSFGVGGQFSTGAIRIEKVGYLVPLGGLAKRVREGEERGKPCDIGTGPNIEGDLKFREWLEAAVLLDETGGTLMHLDPPGNPSPETAGSVPPFDVISHEVNFVVMASGNVTPTWSLVTVSANPNGPLLAATRTRTNNVLITMGPAINEGAGKIRASQEVEFSHLASQIRSNVINVVP